MNSKSIAVGLVFGVGMALALNSWLLEILLGKYFLFKKISNLE